MTNERVWFRLLRMPCCGHQLCWVNPRLPTHCPECGKTIFAALVRGGVEKIFISDRNAHLRYDEKAQP